MEAEVSKRNDKSFSTKFSFNDQSLNSSLDLLSPQFSCGSLYFQVKLVTTTCKFDDEKYYTHRVAASIRLMRMLKHDNLVYACDLSEIYYTIEGCNALIKKKQIMYADNDNSWHQIFSDTGVRKIYRSANNNACVYLSFIIKVDVTIDSVVGSFAALYEDTELADFELKGKDGSVKVHKAILWASSPVFQKMLNGKWKEATEGVTEVLSADRETLEHLKMYIYLRKMPDKGLETLLLLASYYMMPDLVLRCTIKILQTINDSNIIQFIEFAIQHKLKTLLLTILKSVESKVFQLEKSFDDNWTDEFDIVSEKVPELSE